MMAPYYATNKPYNAHAERTRVRDDLAKVLEDDKAGDAITGERTIELPVGRLPESVWAHVLTVWVTSPGGARTSVNLAVDEWGHTGEPFVTISGSYGLPKTVVRVKQGRLDYRRILEAIVELADKTLEAEKRRNRDFEARQAAEQTCMALAKKHKLYFATLPLHGTSDGIQFNPWSLLTRIVLTVEQADRILALFKELGLLKEEES